VKTSIDNLVKVIVTSLLFLTIAFLAAPPLKAEKQSTPTDEKVEVLFSEADALRYCDPEKAKQVALQAAWLAQLANNKEDILRTRRLLSSIYWLTSQYDSALFAANHALTLSVELNNLPEKAATLHTMGIIYRALSDPDRAVELFFEALKIFEQLNDKNGISRLLNSIGILFADQKDFGRAKEYYSRALSISRQVGDLHGIARGLNNLAILEAEDGSTQSRKQYLLEALKINRQTGQKLWEGINYQNLGDIYLEEVLNDSAFYMFGLALQQFQELKNTPQMVSALLQLSGYHEAVGEMSTSLSLADHAMQLADSAQIIRSRMAAAQRLSEITRMHGDSLKSLRYSLLFYQLQDSITNEESVNRIRMIEMLNDYEKTIQAQKLKQQKRNTTFLIIIMAILFVAIMAVVLVLARLKLN
jgi:tetratricopeptide (TPR) repeat protein